MAQRFAWLTQATLYKYRFFIGYMLIVAVVLVTLLVDINTLPNGISQAEMDSAVASINTTSAAPLSGLVNLPFHLVQKVSISLLGLSRLSLVIPSIIFGVATLVLFWLTIRHWFRESTAVVATLVAATTIPLISMIRSGTPEIMLPFWTILFIFASVRFLINREKAFRWKLTIAIAGIGLIYTPYGIYSLVAFLISGILHPHVRSRIRHVPPTRIVILSGIILLGLIPLALAIIHDPSLIYTLTGLDHIAYMPQDLLANALRALHIYGNFTNNSIDGTIVTPAFNIATIALMLLGLFRLIQTHHTARSYALLIWTAVTTFIVLFITQSQSIILMPSLMLLAIGITALISEWYTLFPHNPYARLAGLIPLSILFIGIATGNLAHYFYTFRYIDTPAYSASLSAVKRSIVTEGTRHTTLVTDATTRDFYAILNRRYKNLTVTTATPPTVEQPTFVLPTVGVPYASPPSRIFVTSSQNNNIVLRVYRP